LTHVAPGFPKKCRLGPQNGSGSSGPEKLLKIVSCATIKETENAEKNNGGGPGGLGRWPPRSTWITPRVLKAISLEWSNHQKKLYHDVHTPSPIHNIPYLTLPITAIPQIPHFHTNASFLLQLDNFQG